MNAAGEVKLCDFGVSGELNNSLNQTFIGTRAYMAPERMTGDSHDTSGDVWSLGVTLVELGTGIFPYGAPDAIAGSVVPIRDPPALVEGRGATMTLSIFALLAAVVDGDPPRLPRGHFTQDFTDFVISCCNKEPADRAGLSGWFPMLSLLTVNAF